MERIDANCSIITSAISNLCPHLHGTAHRRQPNPKSWVRNRRTNFFVSGYRNSSTTFDAGNYAIGNDPSHYNQNWQGNVRPHSGNEMMIVNGATQPDMIVWQTGPVKIKPHTTYYFAAYVTSIFATSPPALVFRINGIQVGNPVLPSSTVGTWTQVYMAWKSGKSRKAIISIVDQNIEYYGNDFALDDISFSTIHPNRVSISACSQN